MSYLALYRKYRPSSFSDLVGQSEVVNIIRNEILSNKVSHAYLFSGPRGTGKTSTAKIIAKMINCESLNEDGVPCGKCTSCLNFDFSSDVVEIDAASNNGVDEIRDLRDKVNLVPTYGKYKIYIIDEVHMLTTQAFNALLKTLEEPPSHIVFILATTEFYKIPVTVVSRCQKFQFLKFSIDDIVSRLRYIADCESITINDDVLLEIARLSDGGMRDAINMLDQLSSYKNGDISVDDVYQLNGVLSYADFSHLLEYIHSNHIEKVIEFVENIDNSGKNLDRFIGDFLSFLKDFLIFKGSKTFSNIVIRNLEIFDSLSDLFSTDMIYSLILSLNDLSVRLKNSSFGKILIVSELINLSYKINSSQNKDASNVSNIDNKSVDNIIKDNNKNVLNDNVYHFETKISDKAKSIRINNAFATASKNYKDLFLKKWSLVKEKSTSDSEFFSVTGMINDIEVMVVGECYVILVAQYDSLVDRLYSHLSLIEKLLYSVFSTHYKCVFLMNDEWEYEKKKYVSALKSGKTYQIICDDEDIKVDNNSLNNDVEKIVSILGNDVISYE